MTAVYMDVKLCGDLAVGDINPAARGMDSVPKIQAEGEERHEESVQDGGSRLKPAPQSF